MAVNKLVSRIQKTVGVLRDEKGQPGWELSRWKRQIQAGYRGGRARLAIPIGPSGSTPYGGGPLARTAPASAKFDNLTESSFSGAAGYPWCVLFMGESSIGHRHTAERLSAMPRHRSLVHRDRRQLEWRNGWAQQFADQGQLFDRIQEPPLGRVLPVL